MVVAGGLGKWFSPECGNIRFYTRLFKQRLPPSPPADVSVDTALALDGTGRLDYALKQGPKRDALLRRALQGAAPEPSGPSRLEVKFRTRGKSGTLLHVQESSDYTTVKVTGDRSQKHSRGDQTAWKLLGRLECLLAWKLTQ